MADCVHSDGIILHSLLVESQNPGHKRGYEWCEYMYIYSYIGTTIQVSRLWNNGLWEFNNTIYPPTNPQLCTGEKNSVARIGINLYLYPDLSATFDTAANTERRQIGHRNCAIRRQNQCWVPASRFTLTYHRVIDAKAKNRHVTRCREFFLMTRCRVTR